MRMSSLMFASGERPRLLSLKIHCWLRCTKEGVDSYPEVQICLPALQSALLTLDPALEVDVHGIIAVVLL